MNDLDEAFAALPLKTRLAIKDFASRIPECLAAQIGVAMCAGVSGANVQRLIAEMPVPKRRRLFEDARRQVEHAERCYAKARAAFYRQVADLADCGVLA